ncbi:hypothetical protein SERLADRAFT_477078 [Serpula lacrymans var. lacrymans S7.9]|uniref:Uncharacterized protein n=1 Tax=Serpula lacrymans var. lacrymans (strain S7.9) TaxID=578457 RepID=F8P8A3_SERL9|nr:uncharacterized protein SERLADRAFT_477078 [Serpula lacrymans var. lacrymans S7.9]EGO20659.1 hypothetical protein SERLADRAFT_477078 [Serpula lacrymans var. lacrymans S7.9]
MYLLCGPLISRYRLSWSPFRHLISGYIRFVCDVSLRLFHLPLPLKQYDCAAILIFVVLGVNSSQSIHFFPFCCKCSYFILFSRNC